MISFFSGSDCQPIYGRCFREYDEDASKCPDCPGAAMCGLDKKFKVSRKNLYYSMIISVSIKLIEFLNKLKFRNFVWIGAKKQRFISSRLQWSINIIVIMPFWDRGFSHFCYSISYFFCAQNILRAKSCSLILVNAFATYIFCMSRDLRDNIRTSDRSHCKMKVPKHGGIEFI
jgi:hypothetical protein